MELKQLVKNIFESASDRNLAESALLAALPQSLVDTLLWT